MRQRILRAAPATITVEILDSNGTLTAATGTVTVNITRADGTVVATGRATSAGTETGRYTAALTAAETGTLDLLTCDWKDGSTVRTTTYAEVVGGYYFTVADARAFDRTLADSGKYPDAAVLAARREVEDEFERITACAWVPRYQMVTVPATNPVVLPDPKLRTVRTITEIYGTTETVVDVSTYTIETWGELTSSSSHCGRLRVAYEHGADAPPSDLRHAALTRLRSVLNRENSGLPSNATSFVPAGGGATFGLAQPGRAGFETGIPEIDAVLKRPGINHRLPGVA